LQVLVRDNNVDQALRVLKKKMQREGVFREMKQRRFYEKPSERSNRQKAEAIRRTRKLARKKLQREGLLADPKKKKVLDARGGPGGAGGPGRPGMGPRPPRAF
jgi:small subunit ribosomal protein S21